MIVVLMIAILLQSQFWASLFCDHGFDDCYFVIAIFNVDHLHNAKHGLKIIWASNTKPKTACTFNMFNKLAIQQLNRPKSDKFAKLLTCPYKEKSSLKRILCWNWKGIGRQIISCMICEERQLLHQVHPAEAYLIKREKVLGIMSEMKEGVSDC